MTAPNYQALGTEAHVVTGSLTPTNPSHTTWDWLLFAMEAANVTTFTNPAWTKVLSDNRTVISSSEEIGLWAKFAASGAESNPTATVTTANHAYGNVITFRNVHKVYPIGPVSVDKQVSLTTAELPQIRTVVDDTLLVYILSDNSDSTGAFFTAQSHPTLTLTKRWDAGTTDGNGGGIAAWTAPASNAAFYASGTATEVTAGFRIAVVLALNPIADISISGSVTVDGSPAPNSSGADPKVYLYDLTQPAASYLVLDEATETNPYSEISGGTGEFSFVVPYTDHEYIAVYVDEANGISGSSGPLTYTEGDPGSFDTALININTSSGGGALGFSASQVLSGFGS